MIPQIPGSILKTLFALAIVGALTLGVGLILGLWWLAHHVHFS